MSNWHTQFLVLPSSKVGGFFVLVDDTRQSCKGWINSLHYNQSWFLDLSQSHYQMNLDSLKKRKYHDNGKDGDKAWRKHGGQAIQKVTFDEHLMDDEHHIACSKDRKHYKGNVSDQEFFSREEFESHCN